MAYKMNRFVKNLTRYKLVTFDVTDTLLKYKVDPGRQYAEAGYQYGINCEPAKLAKSFKKHLVQMTKKYPNFGRYSEMSWQTWWKIVVFDTFRDCLCDIHVDEKVLNAIAEQLITKYEEASVWHIADGTRELLTYLEGNGVCLGIISNFDERLPKILKNVDIDKSFKFVVTSYDAYCEKPQAKIFQKALEVSKIPSIKAADALHIGNTPSLDYIGAKQAGWNAILMTKGHKKSEVLNNYPNVDENHVYTCFNAFRRDLITNNIKW